MSSIGDLRDDLHKIHGMLPLSYREKVLAKMVLYGDGGWDAVSEIRSDPKWWGKESLEVVDILAGKEGS